MGSADMEREPSFLGGLWRMRRVAKAGGQYMTNKLVWRCNGSPPCLESNRVPWIWDNGSRGSQHQIMAAFFSTAGSKVKWAFVFMSGRH